MHARPWAEEVHHSIITKEDSYILGQDGIVRRKGIPFNSIQGRYMP
jgi:hypothetical protein